MSLIAFALAVTLSGASADTVADNDADLRCVALVATVVGAGEFEGDAKAGLVGGMMYFIGRIDGRTPGYDLKTGLARLAARPDFQTIMESERSRCAKIMEDRGQMMIEIGDALSV